MALKILIRSVWLNKFTIFFSLSNLTSPKPRDFYRLCWITVVNHNSCWNGDFHNAVPPSDASFKLNIPHGSNSHNPDVICDGASYDLDAPRSNILTAVAPLVDSTCLAATFLTAVLLTTLTFFETVLLTASTFLVTLTLLAVPPMLHHVKPLATIHVKLLGFLLGLGIAWPDLEPET